MTAFELGLARVSVSFVYEQFAGLLEVGKQAIIDGAQFQNTLPTQAANVERSRSTPCRA